MKKLTRFLSLGLITLPVLAWTPTPWGPNPNYPDLPPPLDFQQVANHRLLMQEIVARQQPLLAEMATSADAAAIDRFGFYHLPQADFAGYLQQPALSEARLWHAASGRYSEIVPLHFTQFEIADEQVAEELEKISGVITRWQQDLLRFQSQMDPGTFTLLDSNYRNIKIWLEGWFDSDELKGFLTVAYHYNSDGSQRIIDGLGQASINVESGDAFVEYIVSNPYAQLSREARPDGTVGSIGQPMMDYSFRQMAQQPGVSQLTGNARNNRVVSYLRGRGFQQSCQ